VCSRFSIKGSIKGDGVVFIDILPTAEGLSHAHTVIHTKRVDLMCSEIAIFDLIAPGEWGLCRRSHFHACPRAPKKGAHGGNLVSPVKASEAKPPRARSR